MLSRCDVSIFSLFQTIVEISDTNSVDPSAPKPRPIHVRETYGIPPDEYHNSKSPNDRLHRKNRSASDIPPSLSLIRREKQHFLSAGLSKDRNQVNDDVRTVSCGIETTEQSEDRVAFAPFNSTTNRPFAY